MILYNLCDMMVSRSLSAQVALIQGTEAQHDGH